MTTDTEKQIADARAKLDAAKDGNIIDRQVAVEAGVRLLLDLVESLKRGRP